MKSLLNSYQNGAAETAVYPGRMGLLAPEPNLTGIYYTAMGLAGESGELLDKILFSHWVDENIMKEMGDVMWYISQCAMELGCTLSYIYEQQVAWKIPVDSQMEVCAFITSKAGAYCDCVKKCLRDNHGCISTKYRITLINSLAWMLLGIREMCTNYNMPITIILDMNYQKLASRKKRGALGGDGDNR